jgi:hypothetical protein
MKKILIILVLCAAAIAALGYALAQNKPPAIDDDKAFLSQCGPMVDAALDAYNREDYDGFYRDFVSDRLEKSEKAFREIWVSGYKAQFGNIVSKEFNEDRCDLNPTFPMLVYMGQFEKHSDVTIKAIFSKEDSRYKLFYLRFDVLEPGQT